MSGMTLSPGDIVLTDVVFTDQAGSKQRPVLVLTSPDASGDFVAAMITSTPGFANTVGIDSKQMSRGSIPHASWIRCDRPLTTNLKTVVKPYGVAKPTVVSNVLGLLCPYLGCK